MLDIHSCVFDYIPSC